VLRPDTFALTALLGALTAIGPLSTDMYLPSLPAIGDVFGTGVAQVQLTLSAFLIGFAVGQVIYGPLSDRFGRKPVLLAASLVYIAASAACALSVSVEMLIVARAVQALGACGCIVIARAIVRDLYSGAHAGRQLSLIGSVMAIAPVVAPMFGGLLHTGFGWRAVFWTLVIAGLGLAAVSWRLLPETLRQPASISPGAMARAFRAFLVDGRYLAYLGLAVLSYAGLFAWISTASFILQSMFGLNPVVFGIVFSTGAVGYMTGSLIAARLVVRLGLDAMLGYGSATLAAGGVLMMLALGAGVTPIYAVVVPMALYLAGLGLVLAQSIAGAMTHYPDRAGAASSLLGIVQQSAAALIGVAVAHLLGGNAWPLAGAIAACGCGALLLWIATRRVRAGTV
jgi:DHA1 family bicyclomycin/chloramphenicol resistance-like MFS transporter